MNRILLGLVLLVMATSLGIIFSLDHISRQEESIKQHEAFLAEYKELTKPPITEKIYTEHEAIDRYYSWHGKSINENVTYRETYNGDGKLIGHSLVIKDVEQK